MKILITESQLKKILNEGVFKMSNIGADFTSDDMEISFIRENGILDFIDISGIKDKTYNQIANFIYDTLIEANKNGYKLIKNLEINTGSDAGEKSLLEKLMSGNRFNIARGKEGYNISLREAGNKIENPFSIELMRPSEDVDPPKYLIVYHSTVKPENEFNLGDISSFENGLHVGTYISAKERMTMTGGRLWGMGKPRLYRLIIDTNGICNLNNPINDDDVHSFMLKNKNNCNGVGYINQAEHIGSISINMWNANSILKAEEVDW